MSRHGKLRGNKRCENCGHFVEKRFCPECGQENVETRQRFHYLFTHFIQDFVHYDGRFWKTILYLLFRPAKLTKEYLSGKRKQYVPPVTLYIFISFITFLTLAILPESDLNENKELITYNTDANKEKEEEEKKNSDTQDNSINDKQIIKNDNNKSTKNEEIADKFNLEKLEERIKHDFSKAIFLYMPFFAFGLWLFHSKKKWYYFDHGIYTLHYFSFILLSILLYVLLEWIFSYFKIDIFNKIFTLPMISYFIYYFFHSHRLVYQETKAISRLKCSFLFFINSFFIIVFLILYVIAEMCFSDPKILKEIINIVIND